MGMLHEVEGEVTKPTITPDVQRLIDAGLITEADARKALAEGRAPKLLMEGS